MISSEQVESVLRRVRPLVDLMVRRSTLGDRIARCGLS